MFQKLMFQKFSKNCFKNFRVDVSKIFGVGAGILNRGAGAESESEKCDSAHLWHRLTSLIAWKGRGLEIWQASVLALSYVWLFVLCHNITDLSQYLMVLAQLAALDRGVVMRWCSIAVYGWEAQNRDSRNVNENLYFAKLLLRPVKGRNQGDYPKIAPPRFSKTYLVVRYNTNL